MNELFVLLLKEVVDLFVLLLINEDLLVLLVLLVLLMFVLLV